MKLSISASTESVRLQHMVLRGTLRSLFEQAAQAGYDGLELFMGSTAEATGNQLRELSDETGVQVAFLSAMADLIGQKVLLGSSDSVQRKRFLDEAPKHLSQAACVGACVPIGYSRGWLDGRTPQAFRETVLESLYQYEAMAVREGAKLVIEPINRYEIDTVNTVGEALELIREGGLKHTAVLLDFFHMNIEEVSISQAIADAHGHVGHVHCPDSNRRAPGFGHLNVKRYLQQLLKGGYDGYFGMEVLPLPNAEATLAQGIRYFSSLSR